MNALKPTSTALVRILALPLMAGLLAGCDYASKLPDAPTTLGYELQSKKPPSVTGIEAGPAPAPRVVSAPPPVQGPPPPPVPAPRLAEAPSPAPTFGTNLNTQALEVSGAEPDRMALVVPPSPTLPAPQSRAGTPPVFGAPAPETGLARSSSVGTPPTDFPVAEYQVPQIGASVASDAQFQSYEPIPFDASAPTGGQFVETEAYEPPAFESQSYEVAALPPAPTETYGPAPAFQQQESQVLYSAPPLAAPLPYETVALPQSEVYSPAPMPAPVSTPAPSPIMVLHTRMPSGAVVTVHPVVGAPSLTSTTLARTIASELGAPVDAAAARNAAASFDLRASASRASDTAEAEWKLFSSTGALVGVFGESQRSGTWTTMGDESLRAMGRRVADRLRRNADLRRATLTSVASVPSITSNAYATLLPSGAPSLAPMPRRRPVRGTSIGNAPQPQFVVNTETLAPPTPRKRPEGVRTAALPPLEPITYAPLAAPKPVIAAPVAPIAPVIAQQQPRAPQPLAPLGRPLPAAPSVSAPPAAIPQPSFDTLRAAGAPAPDGPRALVFRGIRGAPGDGNQSLGREVSRLLAQSGAQLAPNGTPNALYLTADVSRSRGPGSDNIKITWHVEDSSGKRIGQVVQENDVPTGQLDNSWGEDAFYAAQGARDGIMELLKSSGALDA